MAKTCEDSPLYIRTHHCGQLRAHDVGQKVRLAGWAYSYRDHGGVIFVDLRDREGVTQLVFDPQTHADSHRLAESIRNEHVLAIEGVVAERPEGMVNAELPTGEIEIDVHRLEILSRPDTLPFELSEAQDVGEDLRLKYRFYDLRRPQMRENLRTRHQICRLMRNHLDELGFLEQSFTAAHGVWLDDDDLKRLADNGCSLAHNPGSDLRLGSGIAPARAAVSHGLNVGIGTDGSHCADNQNMFEAMRLASFASRIMSADTNEWLATDEIVAMATEGSARALGFGDDIGRLVPGAKADIVFLDLTNINFVPFNDPVNQIVHTEDSSAVQSVMVDGEFVLKDRRFTKINYEQLCHDVEDTVDHLQGANADARVIAENLEGMVSQFCVGLAGEPYHIHHWCGHTPSPHQ